MRLQRRHPILACAAALFAVLSLAPTADAQTIGDWVDELYLALTNQPHQLNWQGQLDPTFNCWQVGCSQNIPVVAAAIALVEDPVTYNIIPWWHDFLDCQNGNVCNQSAQHLPYMTGSEQMSNFYNWSVMVSVATVNWWARHNGDPTLQNKARVFLRKNWALYALAAGDGPALTYRHDIDPSSKLPVDGGNGVYTDYCHMNIHGTNIWFDGPFLAMAGARSGQSWFCQDNRMPLLARATAWPLTKNGRETVPQSSVLNYLQSTWPSGDAESVYAVDSVARQILRDQINFGNEVSTMLWVLTNNGATRLRETMHFIGWSGARATLLESNPNGNKPGAVFGAKYTSSNQQAHMMYPWYGNFSGGYGPGYGQLLPTATSPTSAEAFGIVTVTMGLPAASPIYHVVLGPTFNAHQI